MLFSSLLWGGGAKGSASAPEDAALQGFGKATGGKAPAAAKRAAESLREKGLLVNPVYASPNIVIFVYDEDAFVRASREHMQHPTDHAYSTPRKRLAAQVSARASRGSTPQRPPRASSRDGVSPPPSKVHSVARLNDARDADPPPSRLQVASHTETAPPHAARSLHAAIEAARPPAREPSADGSGASGPEGDGEGGSVDGVSSDASRGRPPAPRAVRPSKQPVNGDVPNPHYVYLSAVQQFLCEVHGRAFAVANAGPALATIVPHASELFYHVAPVIEFHEDDASASVPELDCAQPPIASPHAHFTWEFEAFPGTPPLDILVRVAYSMANWLKGFPLRNAPPADKGRPRDRVVALHVNAGLGSPHHTAYFLAACALYLAEGTAGHPRFRSVEEAYCELVNHAPMPDSKDPELEEAAQRLTPLLHKRSHGGSKGSGSPGTSLARWDVLTRVDLSRGVVESSVLGSSRVVVPPVLSSQAQYGNYLQNLTARGRTAMLARGGVPGGARLLLRNFVVFSLPSYHLFHGRRLETSGVMGAAYNTPLDYNAEFTGGDVRFGVAYAAVYQRGQMVWDGDSQSQASGSFFKTEFGGQPIEVCGDVSIAVWRSFDHFEYKDPPAMVLAFHTAYVDTHRGGGERVIDVHFSRRHGYLDFPELMGTRQPLILGFQVKDEAGLDQSLMHVFLAEPPLYQAAKVDLDRAVQGTTNDLLRDATVTPDEMREMSTREVMLQTGRISLEDLERWEEEQRRVRKRTADGANGAGGDGEEEEGEETRDAKDAHRDEMMAALAAQRVRQADRAGPSATPQAQRGVGGLRESSGAEGPRYESLSTQLESMQAVGSRGTARADAEGGVVGAGVGAGPLQRKSFMERAEERMGALRERIDAGEPPRVERQSEVVLSEAAGVAGPGPGSVAQGRAPAAPPLPPSLAAARKAPSDAAEGDKAKEAKSPAPGPPKAPPLPPKLGGAGAASGPGPPPPPPLPPKLAAAGGAGEAAPPPPPLPPQLGAAPASKPPPLPPSLARLRSTPVGGVLGGAAADGVPSAAPADAPQPSPGRPSVSGGPSRPGAPPAPPLGLRRFHSLGPNAPRLRRFFWQQVSQVDESVFAEILDSGGARQSGAGVLPTPGRASTDGGSSGTPRMALSAELASRIRDMFALPSEDDERAQRVMERVGRGRGPAVLETSRANNVSIMAKALGGEPEEVCRQVLSGDGRLREEHVALLMKIVPSTTETRKLRAYEGREAELIPAERLMLALAGIPRLRAKLDILMFTREFEGLAEEVEQAASLVTAAAQAVRESKALRNVLRLVLTVGNVLNDGSQQGNAVGVRLESLLKLQDVKVVAPVGGPDLGSRAAGDGESGPAGTAQPSKPPPAQGASVAQAWRAAVWGRASNLLEFVAAAFLLESGWKPGAGGDDRGGWAPRDVGNGRGGTRGAAAPARSLPGLLPGLSVLKEACGRVKEDLVDVPAQLTARMQQCRREMQALGEQREKEAPFATMLAAFVQGAEERLGKVQGQVEAARKAAESLVVFMAEPRETAPEDVMLMLWQFSARFDIAVAKVAGTRVAS